MATSNIDKQSFGQAGATMLTGTEGANRAGGYCAILILEAAVFDGNANDSDAAADGDCTIWRGLVDSSTAAKQFKRTSDAAGLELPVGVTIYGQFEAVKLRSGTVLCYHAV